MKMQFIPTTIAGNAHRFQPRISTAQYSAIRPASTQPVLYRVNEAVHSLLTIGIQPASSRPEVKAAAAHTPRIRRRLACVEGNENSIPVHTPNRIVIALPRQLSVV